MKVKSMRKNILSALLCLVLLFMTVGATTFVAKAEPAVTAETAVQVASARSSEHLQISIDRKVNGIWLINVTNPRDFPVILQYNDKMCFRGAAEEWKGLNDIRTIMPFQAGETRRVSIRENFFADYITLSYTYPESSDRYITCAHKLKYVDENTKSMTVGYFMK